MMWMALNVAGVALGVWRVGTMGLLPLTSADWLSMIAPKQVTCCCVVSCCPIVYGHATHVVVAIGFACWVACFARLLSSPLAA